MAADLTRDDPIRAHPEGASVQLRVVPRARRTELSGRHGAALKLRVAAPPVEGAANDEVCRFLAHAIGVRPRAVEVLSGERGRDKVVLIRGVTVSELRAELA